MRILMGFYPIDDCGGIINHNEQLVAGLQELGHTVDCRIFLPRKDVPRTGMAGGKGTLSPYTRMEYDQRRGYTWPKEFCIPYLGERALGGALSAIGRYDAVIWQIAVPTKRKENRGNFYWPALYATATPQVAVIHDGNFLDSYPWLCRVKEYLKGLACVHTCAMNSGANIDVPRALILNPQEPAPLPDINAATFAKRQKGVLSVQTFKGWKRVPEYVAAIPYTKNIECHLGGKGIDYYYLTSQDKCKWPGIWDAAVAHSMFYHGVMTNEQRDLVLRRVTCLLDPSWSLKYAKIGGHFNRVMIDAIKQGAIPIARPMGIGGGKDDIFVHGRNCLTIPTGVSPQVYAEHLDYYCNIEYSEYARIAEGGQELLPFFDRKVIAAQYVDLLSGYGHAAQGTMSQQVLLSAIDAWELFFNAKD